MGRQAVPGLRGGSREIRIHWTRSPGSPPPGRKGRDGQETERDRRPGKGSQRQSVRSLGRRAKEAKPRGARGPVEPAAHSDRQTSRASPPRPLALSSESGCRRRFAGEAGEKPCRRVLRPPSRSRRELRGRSPPQVWFEARGAPVGQRRSTQRSPCLSRREPRRARPAPALRARGPSRPSPNHAFSLAVPRPTGSGRANLPRRRDNGGKAPTSWSKGERARPLDRIAAMRRSALERRGPTTIRRTTRSRCRDAPALRAPRPAVRNHEGRSNGSRHGPTKRRSDRARPARETTQAERPRNRFDQGRLPTHGGPRRRSLPAAGQVQPTPRDHGEFRPISPLATESQSPRWTKPSESPGATRRHRSRRAPRARATGLVQADPSSRSGTESMHFHAWQAIAGPRGARKRPDDQAPRSQV